MKNNKSEEREEEEISTPDFDVLKAALESDVDEEEEEIKNEDAK